MNTKFDVGDRVRIRRKSREVGWSKYMDKYVGSIGTVYSRTQTLISDPVCRVRLKCEVSGDFLYLTVFEDELETVKPLPELDSVEPTIMYIVLTQLGDNYADVVLVTPDKEKATDAVIGWPSRWVVCKQVS